MNPNFSDRLKSILTYSKKEAIDLGHDFIGTEHLILGILRDGKNVALDILSSMDVDTNILKTRIKALNPTNISNVDNTDKKSLSLTQQAEKVIKGSYLEAKLFQTNIIETPHILLCILKNQNDPTTKILNSLEVFYENVRININLSSETEDIVSFEPFDGKDNEDSFDIENIFSQNEDNNKKNFKEEMPKEVKHKATPVLDNFGKDLTKMANEGKLDQVVGRIDEIERVTQILCRRKKNNPILIGDPGVGKTAIVEGLALRISQNQVSRVLFNKRVFSLDLTSMVAGTKYRGQFEERIKALMNELEKSDNIILFIDEIHTIIGAGGASGSLDASNILKPALARGEVQCIGATTLDEHQKHFEKDGALDRRFQKVIVEPTTEEQSIEILQNIKTKYETYHNVSYTDEAINACVRLSNRYIPDRQLPDKAIDAMDEAGARIHLTNLHVPLEIVNLEKEANQIREQKEMAAKQQKFEEASELRDKENIHKGKLAEASKRWQNEMKKHQETVTAEHIAEVVSLISNTPITKIDEKELSSLAKLSDEIQENLIGQKEAVESIVKAIKRNRTGLKDPNKPIGSFIFVGQTGVGKTQLAKILAEKLFDSKDALVRIDMSEYTDKINSSKLIGAPPGYVGYEEGGLLTERIRRKPYSIVLLDEIEKAHPDIFNILLQILDDGYITDGLGRKIDFKNTVIIMTSNTGAKRMQNFGTNLGFSSENSEQDIRKDIIEKELKKNFVPEFLNRIDDIIIFKSLSEENLLKITNIEINKFVEHILKLGFVLNIDDSVAKFIGEQNNEKQYGARPLKRAIQKYIIDLVAEHIVDGSVIEKDTINLSVNEDNKLILSVAQKEESQV